MAWRNITGNHYVCLKTDTRETCEPGAELYEIDTSNDTIRKFITADGTNWYEKANTTLFQGNLTLTGVAQRLSTNQICKNVTVEAHPDNASFVYIGTSAVSALVHMAVLSPGSSYTFDINNVNLLYAIGTALDLVCWGGEI